MLYHWATQEPRRSHAGAPQTNKILLIFYIFNRCEHDHQSNSTTTQCNFMINLQYIFNLFLNMLKSASSLAWCGCAPAPPIDQPPLSWQNVRCSTILLKKADRGYICIVHDQKSSYITPLLPSFCSMYKLVVMCVVSVNIGYANPLPDHKFKMKSRG